MKRICLSLALVAPLLAACTEAQPRQFIGPDGRESYSIGCFRNVAGCYEKAGTMCSNGYDILDRTAVVININVQKNELLISCK